MTGVEILVSVLGTVITGVVVWGIKRVSDWLGLKENNVLIEQAEKWLKKAVNAYSDDLEKLINEKAGDITEKNVIIHKIMGWLNQNAPMLMEVMGFENTEQFKQWVWSEVESILSEKKKESK